MALRHVVEQPLSPFSFHEAAAHAMLRGAYADAESLFRRAARIAHTPEGRKVLLEKAEEARAKRHGATT
jgi:hypothetical protein